MKVAPLGRICCSQFFISGNFYFPLVPTSLTYITIPKNKRKAKITRDKKLTTKELTIMLMIVNFLRGFSIRGNLTTFFPGSSPTRPPWQERGPWERDWELYFTIAPFIWHTERLAIFTCSIRRSHCRLFNTRHLIMRKIPLLTALRAGSMTTAKVQVPKCTYIMQYISYQAVVRQ